MLPRFVTQRSAGLLATAATTSRSAFVATSSRFAASSSASSSSSISFLPRRSHTTSNSPLLSTTAAPARASSAPSITLTPGGPSSPKMSIKFSLSDDPGALERALGYFSRHKVNITRLESRPSKKGTDYDFFVDFIGTPENANVQAMLLDLRVNAHAPTVLESRRVPWFPRRAKELDLIANQILDAGSELQSDHPGFSDPAYRARREELSRNARNYRYGASLPKIQYTNDEIATWGAIYNRLLPVVNKYGCAEHVRLLPLLQENCGYSDKSVPQLQDISDFLKECTGFTIRPVAGLLSARNFLYGLAFRTFFSTQYLRHHSRPLYTPEPDLVHELMGHAPLFADRAFADFSQEIGLASIGATDEQITKLARIYWYTVEFGVCLAEDGKTRKAYGAGLLSSFGELEYMQGLGAPEDGKPEFRDFDVDGAIQAGEQDYPITTYQPIYYVARSFSDAKSIVQQFSSSFARPWNVRYNPYTQTLEVDGNIQLTPEPAAKA